MTRCKFAEAQLLNLYRKSNNSRVARQFKGLLPMLANIIDA
jgi:hypothetical protein